MLAVSDSLCVELGGKTIPRRDREFVFNHTSRDHTTYDSPRRALYQPIIRNHLYDVLEQFDYPDPTMPTGSRNSTVVAPQALILLNSPSPCKPPKNWRRVWNKTVPMIKSESNRRIDDSTVARLELMKSIEPSPS